MSPIEQHYARWFRVHGRGRSLRQADQRASGKRRDPRSPHGEPCLVGSRRACERRPGRGDLPDLDESERHQVVDGRGRHARPTRQRRALEDRNSTVPVTQVHVRNRQVNGRGGSSASGTKGLQVEQDLVV
jgi:hypothetical protein